MKILLTNTLLLLAAGLSAQDECKPIGWANYDGEVNGVATYAGAPTGGGSAAVIEVTTFAQLKSAAESSSPAVIYVKNSVGSGYIGTTGDVLYVKSNKTIIGYAGVTVKCSWQIKKVSNIIIRNMTLSGPGNSNANQNWDCVNIEGSKRVWFDHCTVMDGEDGNFDIVKGSNNISVTWCIFTYSADGTHNLSNLVGSSDTETESHGKLNITYACCWWKNVNSRTPRTRYGKVHVLNCYYSNSGGTRAGFMANNRNEACYFESMSDPIGLISDGGQAGIFPISCTFASCTGNTAAVSTGGYTAFTPPYTYTVIPSKDVKSIISNTVCGAGPTMDSPTQCGCGAPAAPTLVLTSGSAAQAVAAGTAIAPIVYAWGGSATDVTVSALPAGLTSTRNTAAKTVTIAGTPAASGTYTVKSVQPSGAALALTGTVTVNIPVAQAPYRGAASPVPGTIQFEHYDLGGNGSAYLDNAAGNTGGATFRTGEDVDLENCTDIGGGYNIGSASAGEWMEYTVNVAAAGAYDLTLRVACNGGGRTVSLSSDGTVFAKDIAIPNTAGWQVWENVTVPNISLSAGTQVIRITVGASDYVNLNYMSFAAVNSTAGIPLNTGWNLVGYPVSGSTDLPVALSNIWANVLSVKDMDSFYDRSQGAAFNTLTKVYWSAGYWVKVDKACTLIWK